MQCTYSIKLLKYKLIYWLFILKKAIFSPKSAKKWHFWAIQIFFLLVEICTHACGVPSLLEYTNSMKLVLYELISWLFILKMAIFWLKMAKNGKKNRIIWLKLLFLYANNLRPCLISTPVIWYGPYCIIGEVLVDLLPFF